MHIICALELKLYLCCIYVKIAGVCRTRFKSLKIPKFLLEFDKLLTEATVVDEDACHIEHISQTNFIFLLKIKVNTMFYYVSLKKI